MIQLKKPIKLTKSGKTANHSYPCNNCGSLDDNLLLEIGQNRSATQLSLCFNCRRELEKAIATVDWGKSLFAHAHES